MTITEKILARAAGLDKVVPGQLINAKIDLVLANDITAPLAIKEFSEIGAPKIFDNKKVVFVPDHFTPNKDIQAAEQAKIVRDFAINQGIIYFEIGQMGVEHALLPEAGLIYPGQVVIGADSHTCTYGALGAFATGMGSTDIAVAMATGEAWFKVPETMLFEYKGMPSEWASGKDIILYTIGKIGVDGARYKSMEFRGEYIDQMSVESRLTMANMAIEAGAKNGIFNVDEKTRQYLAGAGVEKGWTEYETDSDNDYQAKVEVDIEGLEPVVAAPHLPSNIHPVSELEDVKIDQVVIGSCTNGRIEDLRSAASILKDKEVDKSLRVIIIPATQKIYLQAAAEGLIETFIKAGAVVSTPTCGPCLGGHMGILAKGEKAVSTTNRNFVGRMGHVESEVYLASPAVAAASAITGKITHPEKVAK